MKFIKLSLYGTLSALLIAISYAADLGPKEEALPYTWKFYVCEPGGTIKEIIVANNPITLHGLDIAHQKGLSGQGSSIAFLEGGVDVNHLQFKNDQIQIIDLSLDRLSMGEDRAKFRYGRDPQQDHMRQERCFLQLGAISNFNDHGNHILGVALAHPKELSYLSSEYTPTLNKGNHPGGCCPSAKGIVYRYSNYYLYQSTYFHWGSSVLSLRDLIDLKLMPDDKQSEIEAFHARLQPPLSSVEKNIIEKEPIDPSFLEALRLAIMGPAFAINCSLWPGHLMVPTNDFKIPDGILDELASLLEMHDKIVIWAAGNETQCLETYNKMTFSKQILAHPVLSKRMIFSINVCPTVAEDSNVLSVLKIKGQSIPFKLYSSSNYPGDSLQSICLSAVGSEIVSGYLINEFQKNSGTSESAPVIACIATLVKQKFPKLTGIEVIQRLKDTARPLGNPKFSGRGYVWAPKALDIDE